MSLIRQTFTAFILILAIFTPVLAGDLDFPKPTSPTSLPVGAQSEPTITPADGDDYATLAVTTELLLNSSAGLFSLY